jgi:AcrR family transcriptional regulator
MPSKGRAVLGENPSAPGLSDRQIVDVARQLIAEAGVDALTMRRLSEKLGVTLGATYRHVPTKHVLLLLIAHDLYDEVQVPEKGSWQLRLKGSMVGVADIVSRHPGMADFMNANSSESVPVHLNQAIVQILRDAGFTSEGVDVMMGALFFYVNGMCSSGFEALVANGRRRDEVQRLFEHGLDILLAGAAACLRDTGVKERRRSGRPAQ